MARAASLLSASSRAMSPVSDACSRSSSASRRATVSRRARAVASWCASAWPCSRSSARALRLRGQRLVGAVVRRLRLDDRLVDLLDRVGGRLRFGGGGLGRALGLGPAGMEQPRLDRADVGR